MNLRFLSSILLACCLCSGVQAQLRLDRAGHIPGIRKFERTQVNVPALLDAARTGRSIPFTVEGRNHQLTLRLNNMRTPDYKAIEIRPDGDHEVTAPAVATYKGKLDGDSSSEVRFSITRERVHGFVRQGSSWIFIEPLETGDYITYSSQDVDAVPGTAEDVVFTPRASLAPRAALTNPAAAASVPLSATVILDGDAEYMKLAGNWMTNQEAVLNDVEGIYSREVQIQFQLRLQAIHTNAGDFTGTAVCVSSAQDLLTQVNAYWAGRNEGRDLVHLFSGKYFDGGVVGCSNEPSLGENQYSASLTQHIPKGSYSAVEAQQALITAHEMGHTFNGDHMAAAESQDSTCNCLDDTIMWPTFYGTSPTAGGHQMVAHFSAANIQRIVTEAQSSLCQNFTGAGLQSTRFNVFVDDFYQSGAALAVGCPTDATSPWSNGTVQHFSGGSAGTGAILLSTAQSTPGWLYASLWSYYQGRGGPAATFPDGSAIGYPVQNQKAGPGSSVTYDQTVFATMENGQIQSYTSGSKAGQTYSIHGPILSKWTQACLSGKCTSGGPLGMVATEETSASNSPSGTSGTVQGFENGQIYRITSGSRAGAAFYVHAAIWNKYVSLGATSSSLGFPISDEYAWNSGVRNDFEGGYAYTSGSTVNVVTSGAETVSKPSAPSGPGTGSPGSSYSFSTGAAASSQGNQVRYRLVWGDGTDSGWLAAGVSSASKSWANPGTYAVTAQAANASLSVLSPVSDPLTVKVATTPLAAPVLTSPGDGSTGVTNGTALTWNAVSGSAGYSVYFGTTNPPPRVASASGTSYSPGIVQGLTYYWTVASVDPNNNNGEAAAPVRSFAAVKVPVSFTSSPSGLPVTVDGATQNTPFTVSLAAGPHTVSTPSTVSGAGSQNVFSAWSDSGAASHSITVTAGQAASFNATFTTQYQLTLAASPASGGSVTQGSGSFYTAGTVVSVAASPASGFTFSNWSGAVASAGSASTSVTMNSPQTLTANFALVPAPGSVAFNSTPSGLPITVDGATQNTPFSVSLSAGSHTISTPSGVFSTGTQNVFSGWSDNGALSHTINVVAGQSASFTAAFTTQYQLTVATSPSSAAGTVTPSSGGFYPAGTAVPIAASPAVGFLFSNWSGNVAAAASLSTTVLMNGPQTVTANFSAAGTQVSATVFVIQLYRDLLDRNPDSGGLNYWLAQLNSGTSTRTQVAANFFTSPEFVSGGLYIVKLYLAVLNRDPDYGGWLYWFNAYQASTPTSAILASFLSSPEFTSRYGSLTDSAFVTLVYQNVLGRQPDPSGLQYYVNLLGSNQLTRAAVFDQFVQSSEYGTKISPRAYANLLYMGFLRRSADPSGLTYWTNTLTGNPLTVGVDGFINSPEYLTRLQQLVQ